ncbi:hypothetical protein B7L88_gp105 [Rhizobium phage RHEph10]|uniref:hypothetical protein n=1 Tax=Rhizobium phage RHEph10 TaxID=1220717 RepID=UPI0002AB744B|nr:hypothetical protein B7L88_gp105 [Rhizobium phage RHEph10]AGC36183.1 hypothetical protein RHEph10_gp140 [Rhizobium phage RHEph10]
MITAPKQLAPYADRDLDCQAALESTFNQVLLLAEQYGWSRSETAQALQELAFNRLAQEEENRLTTLTIEQLSFARH